MGIGVQMVANDNTKDSETQKAHPWQSFFNDFYQHEGKIDKCLEPPKKASARRPLFLRILLLYASLKLQK